MNNVFIVSQSFFVRGSLKNLLRERFSVENIKEESDINLLHYEDIKNLDLILIHYTPSKIDYICSYISKIKKINKTAKIIVIDLEKDEEFYLKIINLDIDGYLIEIENENELIEIIKLILDGYKYYDTDLIYNILKKQCLRKKSNISSRELEIINEICKNKKNKDIGEKLKISEYTVKRHISNILKKLGLNNKHEIKQYASDYEVI